MHAHTEAHTRVRGDSTLVCSPRGVRLSVTVRSQEAEITGIGRRTEKSVFRSPALPLASERRQEPCLRLRGPRPLVEPVRLRGGPSEPPRGAVEGVDVRGRSQHGHGR